MENILEMLRKGATPESIYQEAIAAQEKLNKEAAEDLKISRLREKVIKALDEYFYTLTKYQLTDTDKKELDKMLKDMEKFLPYGIKLNFSTSSSDKKKTTTTLEDLLKGIWV